MDIIKAEAFRSFAAYICVTDTEMNALMQFYDWEEFYCPGDSQKYYKTTEVKDGQERLILCAQQNEMGMTAAATLSMKMIYQFRPQYLLMVGIAAGTNPQGDEDQMYGDVVLAKTVWNCSNGKYVTPDKSDIRFGTVGFIPRPTLVETDPAIVPYLQQAIDSEHNECYVHFGYMASGSAVVANKEALDNQIKYYEEQTDGLEMESYGVAYAAREATEPRPIAVIAKSVCDFGDARKDDAYQKFAAYTSCEFTKLLCDQYLPERSEIEG